MASADEETERLCQLVKNTLLQSNVDCGRVKVCRKNKDLQHGDFVIPNGVLSIDSEMLKSCLLEETLQKLTADDALPVSKLSQDSYNSVIIHIDRSLAYRNIISEVLDKGASYGQQKANVNCYKIVINAVDLNPELYSEDQREDSLLSLTQLRAVVLLKHLLGILAASGFQPELGSISASSELLDLLDMLHIQVKHTQLRQSDLDKCCESLLAKSCFSKYRQGQSHMAEDESLPEDKEITLNLKHFIENEQLPTGKLGYVGNLNLVDVRLLNGSASKVLTAAAVIDYIVSSAITARESEGETGSDETLCCIHLVSQSRAFLQQQADLVWRICSPAVSEIHVSQNHLMFGSVSQRKSSGTSKVSAKDFYNLRYMQMTQAAMMKYGDHDQGPHWEDMIKGLTAASITLDILSTAASSQVQLDVSEDDGEGGVDNRCGPFILYNCARLASLLNTFQQQVDEGIYPSLPDASKIDFHLLREEEEWTLAFVYIDGFRHVVQETMSGWQPGKDVTAHIHTHKVSHFLLSFSKALSSYYSRYHILGGAEEHLLPMMFARLSLIKAAHQVLRNGLELLGLQPFSQL